MKINNIIGWGGVISLLILSFPFFYRSFQNKKKVHISFDDVSINADGLDSEFLDALNIYNKIYGAKFSLYVFDVPDSIKKSNKINKIPEWIKFSYHGSIEPFDTILSSIHYISNLESQLSKLKKFGGESSVSSTVRLHYYFADSNMLDVAHKNGINTFLSSDTYGRISYSLDTLQCDSLFSKGYFVKGDRKFFRTDLRIENSCIYDCITNGHLSDPELVIFTHQIKFGKWNIMKLHILMILLWMNNYEYVTEL